MTMNTGSLSCQMYRTGSFLKLVDAFASELDQLEQEMIDEALQKSNTEPEESLILEVEGEVNGVYLQFPLIERSSVSRNMSVLDRLTLTHPIWLLLSITEQEATQILLKQPAGVFLVWRSSELQRKVLSLRVDSSPGPPIIQYPVKESLYTFSLEDAGISFADLFHLVAFYCISRDVLPLTLKLPESISSAKTPTELETLARLGADAVLERAMHKCVLKPLHGSLDAALHEFQVSNGEWQRLQENLTLARAKKPRELGVNGAQPPDHHAIKKIRRKLHSMCKMYSPERKVMALLHICKLVYTIMLNHSGRTFGADEFLPMLTYVLVQCDMPQLDTEVQYMMELLDPSLLHGEGGYYLTTAYGAMSLIKNYKEEQAACFLRSTTRNTLHQWHQRRTTQKNLPSVEDFQNYLRVALQEADSGCTAKTLQVRPSTTTEEVCRLCAHKFHVIDPENYGLFLLTDDSSQQLAPDTYPQWIKAEFHSQTHTRPFYFVYRRLPNVNDSVL
uniref:Ras and Rab interactor 2 n=1 Tax=Astyanax mexicanus TaxID=7994 RepID=A0A8B9H5I4_ASTMX